MKWNDSTRRLNCFHRDDGEGQGQSLEIFPHWGRGKVEIIFILLVHDKRMISLLAFKAKPARQILLAGADMGGSRRSFTRIVQEQQNDDDGAHGA